MTVVFLLAALDPQSEMSAMTMPPMDLPPIDIPPMDMTTMHVPVL